MKEKSPIKSKIKDVPNMRYFQFRMRRDLFDDLVAEVRRRQQAGEEASINQVGQEWMERGRDANHVCIRDSRPR